MSAPVLEARDLHVWFSLGADRELHAVRGVSFSLLPGERFGLVGESGCGKTTTILGAMGLLPAKAAVAGSVFLDGEDVLARGEASDPPAPLEGRRDGLPGRDERVQPGAADRPPARRADGAARHRDRQAARAGRASCSSRSGSPATGPTATRTSCPAACASGRRSRWPWPASRRCSWPTSRRRRST